MNKSWLPNILTFFRFALAIVVVVLMHVGEQIYFEIACWGVVLAGLTDFLDGMFARKYKLESNFGKFLDPLADKVFVFAALVMLVWLHRIEPVLVIVIMSREVLITGIRAIAGSQGIVIPAGMTGKIKTTFQMIGIGALILYEEYFWLDAHIVGTICIWVSLYFSLVSAYDYVENYVKLRST